METFRFSAPVLIALIASLMLLLSPDPNRVSRDANEQNDANPPLAGFKIPGMPAQPGKKLANPLHPLSSIPVEQAVATSSTVPDEVGSATTGAAISLTEWPLIIYPELTRIAELENLHPDSALVELLPMLADGDPVVRLAALESVADMSRSGYTSIFAAALDDPLPQIRITAVEALAASDDPAAWVYLQPFLYDENAEVRIAAIEALAAQEEPAAIPALAGLLSDQEISIRNHAVNALGEIGGANAIAYLLQARNDPQANIRANADAILQEIATTAAD